MKSLRSSIQTMSTALNPALGIKGCFAQNQPLYRDAAHVPFSSLRQFIRGAHWPRKLIKTSEHPRNARTGWCDNLNGIACDGQFWYFSEQYKGNDETDNIIWKIPLSWDLAKEIDRANPPAVFSWQRPPQELKKYTHFSDLDVIDDYIFLSMEGGGVGKVAVFDKNTLAYQGAGNLQAQNPKAPWVAVRKQGARYVAYSTRFGDNPDDGDFVDRVFTYEISVDPSRPAGQRVRLRPQGALLLKGKDGSPLSLDRLQGGTISANNHLYLLVDKHHSKNGGVFGFDLYTGICKLRYKIQIKDTLLGLRPEELEGMCYFPLDHKNIPGGINGHLHIPMLNKAITGRDNVYIKHLSTIAGQKEWI